MKKLSFKKYFLLFIITCSSLMVCAQKIDCEHNQEFFFIDEPVKPAIRTHALRIASENNLNAQRLQNEWYFSIIVGITSETTKYFGGFDAVITMILDQYETINAAFNEPGVFNEQFNFSVESIYEFSGNVYDEIYYRHPDYDFKVIIDGFPTAGGGWYGSLNTIYHSWSVSSWQGPFAAFATDGIIHEFGHSRGAIDLYALELPGSNNPINNASYNISFPSIMDYPYGVTTWDKHSINLINMNKGENITTLDYIHNSFPSKIVIHAEDPSGDPVSDAVVKLFPVRWYGNRVVADPLLEVETDIYGNVELVQNPFQPSISSTEAWRIEYCNFLVEVSYSGMKYYKWMPIFDVQNHYFNDPVSAYEMSFTLPVSDANIIVNAKGSEVGGVYAHFKVVVDGQEIGDSFTTSNYEPYIFPVSIDPSAIKEIRVVFDNDLYTVEEDRNLFVHSITIGEKAPIEATSETVSYITAKGHELVYNGMMQSNGALIFAIENIFNPIPYTYISIQGDTYELFLWEGESIVLLTKSKDLDHGIMRNLVSTFDDVYNFYSTATGRKPALTSHYNGKTTIAQVDATCGAGCGYLGFTGIEVLSKYFDEEYSIYESEKKYGQIIFYEFGRNFWFYGNKIEMGSSATAFAVFMRDMAFEALNISPANFRERPFEELIDEVKGLLPKYMADPTYNWENTIRVGKAPPNSYGLGGESLLASFLYYLKENYGGLEFINILWKEVDKRPDATNEYDAADNFILASSIVAKQNLVPLFQKWKWPVSEAAINEANQLFGTSSLVINAKGSVADGVYAHFKLEVDGEEVGHAFTTSNYEDYIFQLDENPFSIQEVKVVFDNDTAINGMDRSLFVKNIQLGSRVIPAINSEVVYVKKDGQIAEYNGEMRWNGALIFDPREKIIVNARGSQAAGEYAHFKVLVDGIEIGDAKTTRDYTSYSFPLATDPSIIKKIKVVFDNDTVIDGADRNLYVNSVTIEGEEMPAPAYNVFYIKTDGQFVKYNGVMDWNGELLFDRYFQAKDCDSDVVLSSQYDVNTCSCTEIQGDLRITGSDIANLDGLSELTYIGRGLEIQNNPYLTDINGLSALYSIGIQLFIRNNTLLENLSGLDNMEEVGDHLIISDNNALKNINGISKLKYVGLGVNIENNHSLKTINGFNLLQFVNRDIAIAYNQSLERIDGFNAVSMSYEVYIGSNKSLKSINGFNSYSEVDKGIFLIKNNPELETIDCISALERGIVVIDWNNSLKDIIGPSTKPYGISMELTIRNNIALENVDGLKSMTKASLILNDNASLTNLNGLENLNEALLTIEKNTSLVSFCGLYPLVSKGEVKKLEILNNGIEITKEEILANGPCDYAEIVVNAKGSEAGGENAHFKVLVNNQEIGDDYATSDYQPYRFPLSVDPSAIQNIQIVFDNDTIIDGDDRDLYIHSIEYGDSLFVLEDLDVLYYDKAGNELNYDNGMPWNGTLVLDFTTPEPPIAADIILCEGDTIPVLSASGKNLKWYQDTGLKTLLHSGSNFKPASIDAGTYNYYVTQTLNGRESNPDTLTLIINNTPELPICSDVTYCEGDPIAELHASGNNIRWYHDRELTNLISTGNNLNSESTAPGIYHYFPTQTISGCESDPTTLTLTIHKKPSAPICNDVIVCEEDSLIALQASGDSIYWYDDDQLSNLVANGNRYMPVDIRPGKYSFYLIQVISGCAGYVDSVELTIKETPPPPQFSNVSVCFGEEVPALTADGTNINWYDDGYLTNLLQSGNAFYSAEELPGQYEYYITQTFDACESRADTANLTIYSLPIIYIGEDTAIAFDAKITLAVPDGFINYLWNTGSQEYYIIVDGTTAGPGEYTFSLQAEDINQCINSDTIKIAVLLPTGLDEHKIKESVKIYPTPAKDYFNISFKEPSHEKYQLKMLDLSGRNVLSYDFGIDMQKWTQLIDVSQFKSGVYILKILSNDQILFLQKVIIQ